MRITRFGCWFLLLSAGVAQAQQVIPLWKDGAPGFEARRNEPEQHQDWWYKNIHNPSLTVFLPPPGKANGTAVVVAPGGGHRELVRDRETGVLFRAGDAAALAAAVIEVAGDAALRQRLTTAGPQYVRQERTWAKVVERYVPVYNSLISNSATHAIEVRT